MVVKIGAIVDVSNEKMKKWISQNENIVLIDIAPSADQFSRRKWSISIAILLNIIIKYRKPSFSVPWGISGLGSHLKKLKNQLKMCSLNNPYLFELFRFFRKQDTKTNYN